MRNDIKSLVVLALLFVAAGCAGSDADSTAVLTYAPQSTETPPPPDLVVGGTSPACLPADGAGTVSPAVSIYSVTYVVNGVEQIVRDGDTLQAAAGDQLQVREVTICTGSFSGSGGEACVDFVPLDQGGQEIAAENGGTHMVWVTPGLTTIAGPDHTWTVAETWQGVSAVLNHWPPERSTQDISCGGGRCEHDDWMVVEFGW